MLTLNLDPYILLVVVVLIHGLTKCFRVMTGEYVLLLES